MKRVTNARAIRIRNALERLIEYRLAEMECDSLMEYQRRYPGQNLFHSPLCPFVNWLCPDDLCYLPADHEGTAEGFHITGTTAYDYAIQWTHGDEMAPVGTSRYQLVRLGSKLQRQMEREDGSTDGV